MDMCFACIAAVLTNHSGWSIGTHMLYVVVTVSIDNILPYGYETNHVSALISITSSGSILVSRVKSIILVLQFYTR